MIEIRLEAPDPASIEALLAAGAVGGIPCVPGTALRRVADLLDTPDWALARARVALERSRRGRRRDLVAVWNAPGDDRGSERREVRQVLASPPRPPSVVPKGPVADRVRAIVAGRPLHAVLSFTLARRRLDFPLRATGRPTRPLVLRAFVDTLLVGPPDGVQASRLDEVVVRSPAAGASYAERLAAVLAAEFRLVPSRMTRELRALMLVHGDVPFLDRASGAVAVSDFLGIAARKVFALNLRRVQEHDPGTRSGGDPEDLHDMRVGTRRLRAALRVFAPALAPAVHDRFAAGLRRLGRQLGTVRDLDVQVDRARTAPPAFLSHLDARRAGARARMLRALDRAPYLRLVADLDRFASGGAVGETPAEALDPVGPHAAGAIARAYRRLRQAGRRAAERPTAAALHEVRIRAKRLRYALEFFQAASGADATALVETLTELQDLLGAHQDAVVGARLARAWGRAEGEPTAVAARVAVERGLAEDCRRSFGRAWVRVEERETRRRVERVVRRLDPERRDKKKGDAASGVP